MDFSVNPFARIKAPMASGYQDIENILQRRIEQGDLKPGDRVGPIRQLAETLGVSLVTADRALRELTRKGVLTRAARQGFFVAAPAVRLKGNIHAILVTLDRRTPFADLLNGIIDEVWPQGYQLSVSCSQGSIDTCMEAARRAVLEPVRGVIYMAGGQTGDFEKNREPIGHLLQQALPVVTVGHCRLQGVPPLPGVSSAHEQAGYDMTRHLLSKQLKKIAVLGIPPNQDEQAIIAGCQRACHEANVPLRPNWIRFHGPSESVAQNVQYLLNGGKRPDAIFALSDLVATEVMAEIRRAGLSVPRDISIVGFGDYPIAELVRPALTTMRINLHAVGSLAANTLIRMIEGRSYSTAHTEIPCQLLVRDSCIR